MMAILQATAALWIPGVGATLLLLLIAFRRDGALMRIASAGLLALAAVSAAGSLLENNAVTAVTPLLNAGGAAQTLAALFCILGVGAVLLPAEDALSSDDQHDEYYLLTILAVLGANLLVYASHAASLLLGVELLSISLYALIAYPSRRPAPLEAAIKYMLISGAASAAMLFGLAMLYAGSGDLSFSGLLGEPDGLSSAGATLLLAGLALKTAVVPFHLWTPDVYEGAPTPVSALLVTITSGSVVYALLRLGFVGNLVDVPAFTAALSLLAFASILAGNWMALLQENLKRLLAYSSIAHSGYLLVALAAGARAVDRELALEAGVVYLFTYLLANFAAFAVLAHLKGARDEDRRPGAASVTGMFWRSPLLAGLFMVALLSMAGVPMTAGFIGKIYLFSAAAASGQSLLLWALVIGSAIGVYYYLRLVYAMTLREGGLEAHVPGDSWRWLALVLGIAIVAIGVVPGPLTEHLQALAY